MPRGDSEEAGGVIAQSVPKGSRFRTGERQGDGWRGQMAKRPLSVAGRLTESQSVSSYNAPTERHLSCVHLDYLKCSVQSAHPLNIRDSSSGMRLLEIVIIDMDLVKLIRLAFLVLFCEISNHFSTVLELRFRYPYGWYVIDDLKWLKSLEHLHLVFITFVFTWRSSCKVIQKYL